MDVKPFSRRLFGFVTCAQTASPCFTRPMFELGLSSRAPQVSAQRVRLSCSIKSRVFSFKRHHEPNVGRPRHTCRHHRLNQWSSRLVSSMTRSWTLHASSCGCIRVRLDRVFLNCLRTVRHPLPWHSMATSSITNSLVQNLRRSFHSQAPGTSPVLQLGCELLSLCSSTQDHFSPNSHRTNANNIRERPSLQESGVKVTTSIAQTAVALASKATSTSRCHNQQKWSDVDRSSRPV